MVYILCMLCLNIDNKSVPTVCEERCLAFLSFYGPVSHLIMAEMDSKICSAIEENSIHKIYIVLLFG